MPHHDLNSSVYTHVCSLAGEPPERRHDVSLIRACPAAPAGHLDSVVCYPVVAMDRGTDDATCLKFPVAAPVSCLLAETTEELEST